MRNYGNDPPTVGSSDLALKQTEADALLEQSADVTSSGFPLLHLSAQDDIWLGNSRLPPKRFPKMLRRLLKCLWENRTGYISYAELEKKLYPTAERADPQSSRDHLVRRLRLALEPGKSDSKTYIDTQTGSGLVLRNWSDRDPMPGGSWPCKLVDD